MPVTSAVPLAVSVFLLPVSAFPLPVFASAVPSVVDMIQGVALFSVGNSVRSFLGAVFYIACGIPLCLVLILTQTMPPFTLEGH